MRGRGRIGAAFRRRARRSDQARCMRRIRGHEGRGPCASGCGIRRASCRGFGARVPHRPPMRRFAPRHADSHSAFHRRVRVVHGHAAERRARRTHGDRRMQFRLGPQASVISLVARRGDLHHAGGGRLRCDVAVPLSFRGKHARHHRSHAARVLVDRYGVSGAVQRRIRCR